MSQVRQEKEELPVGIRLIIEGELVELKSWSELEARPDFASRLPKPDYFPLSKIVGVYYVPIQRQCGRSECGRWHKKGYVVETAKGMLLNIGNKCGANYFEVDYNDLAVRFDRYVSDLTRRRRLEEFKMQHKRLLEEVLDLRALADRFKDGIKALKSPDHLVPRRVTEKLAGMVTARDPVLRVERHLTREEHEIQKAMGQKGQPEVVEEEIDRIPGLSALYPESDFREVIYLALQKPLEDFDRIELDGLSHNEAVQWSKFYSEIGARKNEARKALRAAKRLLKQSSLEPFRRISDPEERKVFDQFLRDLPE